MPVWKNEATRFFAENFDHADAFECIVGDALATFGRNANVDGMRSDFASAMSVEVDAMAKSAIDGEYAWLGGHADEIDYDAVFSHDAGRRETDVIVVRDAGGKAVADLVLLDSVDTEDKIVADLIEWHEELMEPENDFLNPANLDVKGTFDAREFLLDRLLEAKDGGAEILGRDGRVLATIERKPFFKTERPGNACDDFPGIRMES